MKRSIVPFILGVMLLIQIVAAATSEAACAKVSMEILQQMTVERVAFDAKLAISNGIPDQALQNIRVDVTITDGSGNVKNDIFFVRPPILTNLGGALDGTGSVAEATSGEAHWLIIPSPGAGYTILDGSVKQIGVDYWVGATLSYTIGSTTETIPINPAKITVKPMPQLVLDYFVPSQVLGDNPFTPQVEPPVPYPLAVRVMNDGYGTAVNLRIDSAQPKIIDNKQGLLIDFKILGAAVNDSTVTPSLMVNLGDLASKKGATASWQMISTLSGHFSSFSATFTHASELGGELTSFIKVEDTKTHFLTHMVKVNLPGRDNHLDFLADLNDTTGSIYESEIPAGYTTIADARQPVTVFNYVSALPHPTPSAPNVSLALPTSATGWIYAKLADPSQGLLKLLDVVRGDGVHLDPHNFWVDQVLDANYKKTWTLQFIDYRSPNASAPGAYTLLFAKPDVDTTPPTTTLIFDGPATGSNPAYITPQTRLLLTAVDNDGGSGVDGMFKQVDGLDSDFIPAVPFTLATPGNYTVNYYSVDLAGKEETAKSAGIVVVSAAPTISSFTVTPAAFSPQAPRGVAAARTVDFKMTATSSAATLPVEIAIASGAAFQSSQVVRTLKGNATPGTELRLAWDGKDASGKLLATGTYTAQVKVADGLDNPSDANAPVHTSTVTVTVIVAEWFIAAPVDPNPVADQLHPRVSGTKVVWQDLRNGYWDIYLKDLAGTASSSQVPRDVDNRADRQYPSTDGTNVVWQDFRNGKWDIYGYNNLQTPAEFRLCTTSDCTEPGNKTNPVISGYWVAWQDNRSGNWDIYASNIMTKETVRITSHERDQIHPAIVGTTVTWEDYRHGFGEIYQYDLATRTETWVASGPADETFPALSGQTLVWSDLRNGQNDIYTSDPVRGALRLTYGTGNHSQATIQNGLLIYTDYEAGADDPNLSFLLLSSGAGGRLTSDPARQEEPALGNGSVLWQDNRVAGNNPDKHFQIYAAPFVTEAIPIEVALKPGFNLVAVGGALATLYPSASALITAKADELGIDRILLHDPLHNTYTEAKAGDVGGNLAKGTAVVIYAQKSGTLKLAESGETAAYTLLPGTNQIGILTVPFGYSAYDLMNAVGLDNIQSVRRFDTATGAWQSVAVRMMSTKNGLVGQNYVIQPGDGLVVMMKNRVDGWTP